MDKHEGTGVLEDVSARQAEAESQARAQSARRAEAGETMTWKCPRCTARYRIGPAPVSRGTERLLCEAPSCRKPFWCIKPPNPAPAIVGMESVPDEGVARVPHEGKTS